MAWKTVEEMTGAEVVNEAESLASYAEGCREIEQGINSKEVIRFNRCMTRIEEERLTDPSNIVSLHLRWNPDLNRFYDMMLSLFKNGGTLAGMRKLFAA
jgi:hypothetical protein